MEVKTTAPLHEEPFADVRGTSGMGDDNGVEKVAVAPPVPGSASHSRRAMLLLLTAFLVLLSAGAAEYWYSSTQSARLAAPLGQDVTVEVLAEQIRIGLAADPMLRMEHVSVATANRRIELSGKCSSQAARALVNRYAARVIDNRFVLVDNTQIIPLVNNSAVHRTARR